MNDPFPATTLWQHETSVFMIWTSEWWTETLDGQLLRCIRNESIGWRLEDTTLIQPFDNLFTTSRNPSPQQRQAMKESFACLRKGVDHTLTMMMCYLFYDLTSRQLRLFSAELQDSHWRHDVAAPAMTKTKVRRENENAEWQKITLYPFNTPIKRTDTTTTNDELLSQRTRIDAERLFYGRKGTERKHCRSLKGSHGKGLAKETTRLSIFYRFFETTPFDCWIILLLVVFVSFLPFFLGFSFERCGHLILVSCLKLFFVIG